MYSRFIFDDFKGKDMKGKEFHKYGAFVDPCPLKNVEASEMAWMTKLRINQARLISKQEDNSSHMVAFIPCSFCTLPPSSFLSKHDYDESLFPWDHLPCSFNLNFLMLIQALVKLSLNTLSLDCLPIFKPIVNFYV